MRRLFHLTAEPWWEAISAEGQIVSLAEKRRRDPDFPAYGFADRFPEWERRIDGLIWLTANPAADQAWQGDQPKGAIRIEVDVDEAQPWNRFGRDEGCPPELLRSLARTGGNSGDWYVVERPIPREEWVRVERTATGEVLWVTGQAEL